MLVLHLAGIRTLRVMRELLHYDSTPAPYGVGSELLTAGIVVCPRIAQIGMINIFPFGFWLEQPMI